MWRATRVYRRPVMSLPVEVLAKQVLDLALPARARLLDEVICSLDADREREARWNGLAALRDEEADTDPSVLISGPDALGLLTEFPNIGRPAGASRRVHRYYPSPPCLT